MGLCTSSRRNVFKIAIASCFVTLLPKPDAANARFIMNEETGDYEEVVDKDWQTTWKERLDKAQTMTSNEVFRAGQGVGNTNLKDGAESDASKKRRAMSACRDNELRKNSGILNVKECTNRVIDGEIDFILGKVQM